MVASALPDHNFATMPVRPSGLPRPLRTWGMALLIIALTVAVYLPAMRGGMLWDDPAHVTPPALQSWHGLERFWTELGATQQYYPVLFTAFWVEHRLWGDHVLGYHLVNILLHAGACCLLALLLRRLWTISEPDAAPGSAPREPAGAAWFAAALFAVHPVCVESVAWISEQKNTLALTLALLASLAFLRFWERRTVSSYAAALGLFLLALGSKTATAPLPAALLVMLWWRRGRLSWRRDVAPLLPWFAAAVTAGLFTSWVERNFVGAAGATFSLTAFERLMLAGRVVRFYLGTLAWPAELTFFYPRWDVPGAAPGWIAGFVALAVVTVILWAIRRRMRGPLAAWLLYGGLLFPALGFFNVYPFVFSYVADHFQYFASGSLIAAVATGAAIVLAGLPPRARVAGWAAGMALIVALAWAANRQSALYRNNETLFRATIARNPTSWMAHQILAVTFARAPHRHAEAIAEYRTALRLNPDYPDAHFGLGVELARLPGHRAEAIAQYERAVQLRPIYAEAHNNLGVELAKTPGRTADAIANFEAALAVKPGFAEAHANLADVLARLPGRQAEAVKQYETALHLKPGLVWARCHLAFVLAESPARINEGIAQYHRVLRDHPDNLDALNGLAIAEVRLGHYAEARSRWEQALRIAPHDDMIRKNLELLERMEPR